MLSHTMPITLSTLIDRTSLRPNHDTKCFVALEIEAAGTVDDGAKRIAARTVLALDTSGSMKGEPLDQVIRSVDRMLDALGPDDEVGIIAFAENATRVVEPVKVDAAGKRLVRSRVGRLHADGGTNIEAGLDLAAELMATTPHGMRRGVVLLSDGAPNRGAHTIDGLRGVVARHRPHISFFSLGYGVDHSEDVLSAIGEAGGGGYEFVQDPASCARSFARALGAQGDVVASGIEVVLCPADGVELVRFVGHEQTKFSREGVVVSVADMVNGARRLVVAELRVKQPSGERFAMDLVKVTARWRDRSTSSVVNTITQDGTVEIAEREPTVQADAARRVLLSRADEAREASRQLADRGQFGAAASGLRALMAEIERLPGWVMNDGTPLAEAYELLVDEAMAFERRPSAEQYAAFRKATVNSKLAVSSPKSARARGDASAKLIEHIAGDRPNAWLVHLSDASGRRHPLAEECVIGRTSSADIAVSDPNVSRRHAEIFANMGEYWVADLGSTNTTMVNGRPLTSAPHRLLQGDVIRLGDVELRYEEEKKKPID